MLCSESGIKELMSSCSSEELNEGIDNLRPPSWAKLSNVLLQELLKTRGPDSSQSVVLYEEQRRSERIDLRKKEE